MLRSLYTAASGMMAQQTQVDVISNNLANVNTTGYKSESTTFKSLLYQDLQAKTTSANGEYKPVSAQVGLGSRVSAITSQYTQGSSNATEKDTDFMINGKGFFACMDVNGDINYTRNGNFIFARGTEGAMLCTMDGYPVLSADGTPIVLGEITEDFYLTEEDIANGMTAEDIKDLLYTADGEPKTFNPNDISVDTDGNLCYPDRSNNSKPIGVKIGLFQFSNPSGLNKVGGTYLQESEASGVAINEEYDEVGEKSTIKQGYLESSNVNVATEVVNLITAQRAYELCSKAITTSDSMMEQANNLKR